MKRNFLVLLTVISLFLIGQYAYSTTTVVGGQVINTTLNVLGVFTTANGAVLGTPTSINLTNATALPLTALPGDGTTWTACPTLQASWANFGSSYQVCEYQKNSGGYVTIRGVLQAGTLTAATTIMTMPVGYRPPTKIALAAFGAVAAGTGYNTSQMDINTNGTVVQQTSATLFAASGAWLFNLRYSVN